MENQTLGYILIETENTIYYPGDIIQGKIHLSVKSQHVLGQKLILKNEGSQQVESERQGSDTTKKENQNIYDYEIPIHHFNGKYLPLGNLTFPFEVRLGRNIPGSMELNDQQNKFSCKIQYKLIAVIKTYNNEISLQKEEAFIIQERINEIGQQLSRQMQPEIKEWHFFNKGHTFFQATIDNNQFFVGEICKIVVFLNNANCDKIVRYIYVKLINNITIRFNNGQQKQIKRVLTESHQPGMAARTNTKECKILELPITDSTQNQLYGTVNSNLIQSSFLIEASIEIKINCFDLFTPAVELPITVVTQEPEKKFTLPPDWEEEKIGANTNKVVISQKRRPNIGAINI